MVTGDSGDEVKTDRPQMMRLNNSLDVQLTNLRWLVVLMICLQFGCAAFRPGPKLHVLKTLKTADRIVANGHEITDPNTMSGFRKVYRDANWRPLIDASPMFPIQIEVYTGDEKKLTFYYGASWLMEDARKGVLNQKEQQWMDDHLISKIPAENLPQRNIL